MASWLRAYNALLQRRPLTAQAATTAVLSGTGDVIAQQLVECRRGGHDWVRTARQAFWGGALLAPAVYRWYGLLQRLPVKNSRAALVARVALDQVVFAPLSGIGFFATMAVLEGNSFTQTKARMDEVFMPTLLRGYAVFVPAQLVNFGLVPPSQRFAFIGVVRVGWNTYLSLVNARAERHVVEYQIDKNAIPARMSLVGGASA